MTIESQIDLADSGKDLEAIAEKAMIALPAGWSKMSIDRKKRALRTAASTAPAVKLDPAKGIKAAATKALAGIGKRLAKKPAEPKTPAEREKARWDKLKKRQQDLVSRHGAHAAKRRVIQLLAGSSPSKAPENLSRQVIRFAERRVEKMPLGMTATEWHKLKGYGKINDRKARGKKVAKAA